MAYTLEEALAMKKGKARLEEMTELDKDIAGREAKHIIIPMTDVYNLRRIAGLLHGLAASLDQLSRRGDWPARTIILETRAEIDDTNKRIREMTGKGKRKRPWEREDNPRYREDVDKL